MSLNIPGVLLWLLQSLVKKQFFNFSDLGINLILQFPLTSPLVTVLSEVSITFMF